MSDSRSLWREPTIALPLRWGSYRSRLLAGVCLIFAGGILLQLTSAYTLMVLPIGLLIHSAGWCILPGIGWRRVVGAAASAMTMIVLLNGAPSTVFLVVPLAAWLVVRLRPLLSYSTLIIPLITSWFLAQLFPDYGWSVIVLLVAGTALIGAAWLSRILAAVSGARSGVSR